MARLAVLAGRTVSDLFRNIMVLVIITGVGFLVGFRPTADVHLLHPGLPLDAPLRVLPLVGLRLRRAGRAQLRSRPGDDFPVIFPADVRVGDLRAASSQMPSWLQPFANNQPVSQTAIAVRGLMLGQPHGHSTWIALAWALGAIVVLAPLAVNKYRKVA